MFEHSWKQHKDAGPSHHCFNSKSMEQVCVVLNELVHPFCGVQTKM